jgi:adenine-specific DNA-methyltransferase
MGTQPQFKKLKPPVTYRYDSWLSPALDWDGRNHVHGGGSLVPVQRPKSRDINAPSVDNVAVGQP